MSHFRSKIGCLPIITILMVAGYMKGAKNGPASRPLFPERHEFSEAEAPSLKHEAPL